MAKRLLQPAKTKTKQKLRGTGSFPGHSGRFGKTFRSNQNGIYEFALSADIGAKTTDTSGNLLYFVNIDPTVTANWSSMTPLFDQYRIQEVIFYIFPSASSGSIANGPCAVSLDMDSTSVTPTTLTELIQRDDTWLGSHLNAPGGSLYASPSPYRFTCPSASQALAGGLGDWTDVAAAAPTGQVSVVALGLIASTLAQRIVIQLITQFRAVR
jgi:hypothetical protein